MSELKTVNEIMSMVCLYGDNCLFRVPTGNALADIRAAITDLHAAATRKQDSEYVMKDVEVADGESF